MGLIKSLFEVSGEVVGALIGGTVEAIGNAVDSDFIRDVGKGAYSVTSNTGRVLGTFAGGACDCVAGAVTKDTDKVVSGMKDMCDMGVETVSKTARGIKNVVCTSASGVKAICDGDVDTALRAGKALVKGAAIGVLSFSVLDAIDGSLDGVILDFDHNGVPDFLEGSGFIDNPNMHHVTPHERHFADGTSTWVDGDGNPAIDTFDGWFQHNPDFHA